MLKIYNSQTQKKAPFKPIEPGKISLYVCGITVYDDCHIGHARTFIVFDMVVRYLRSISYQVNYVRNITDIDDKIIRRAHETGQTAAALAAQCTKKMHQDFSAFRLLSPIEEPKATDYIEKMITFIEGLIQNGHAYPADNGDVYFAVRAFEGYGKLSKRTLDDLKVGARIEANEAKRDPLDFVLWKAAKPGEPSWASPWGDGRPGWHLECSVMSKDCLAEQIDIHGGGHDLKFPHHENELAQSEALSGKPFVGTWMHVGALQVNQTKMSKSLKNFFTIEDVLQEIHPETIKYFMISGHYRSPVDYSKAQLASAHQALTRLYTAVRDLTLGEPAWEHPAKAEFEAAMNDDFNTPIALSVLFALANEINNLKTNNTTRAGELAALLVYLGQSIGVLMHPVEAFFKGDVSDTRSQEITQLIAEREAARRNKDWATADKIRDQLLEKGIVLEDKQGQTIWRTIT